MWQHWCRASDGIPGKEMCIIPFGQISSRPRTTSPGPPKGSVLEGKWDPENFREIVWLVKYYEPVATAQLVTLVPMTDPWNESFTIYITNLP